MNTKLLALYGLKYNPFTPDVPTEALHIYPKLENFYWRVEHSLIGEGGFALVSGDSGTGKALLLELYRKGWDISVMCKLVSSPILQLDYPTFTEN